jgi:hypothetical protein
MAVPSWDVLISYGGSAVELVGAAIGLARWRRIAGGQRMITIWFGAATLSDIAAFVTARWFHNNQPSGRIWFALSVVFALEALAAFQVGKNRVMAFRVAIVAYLAAWALLAAFVEPLPTFSTYTEPLHALVILTAAVLTLLRRASLGRGDLFDDPGFLIAAGLAGYAVATVLETLVGQLWLHDAPQYVNAYYAASNIVTALGEIVIIKGLFLPPYSSHRSAP